MFPHLSVKKTTNSKSSSITSRLVLCVKHSDWFIIYTIKSILKTKDIQKITVILAFLVSWKTCSYILYFYKELNFIGGHKWSLENVAITKYFIDRNFFFRPIEGENKNESLC